MTLSERLSPMQRTAPRGPLAVVEPKAAVIRETAYGTYSVTFRRGSGALRVIHLDTLLSALRAGDDFASMGYRVLDLTQ